MPVTSYHFDVISTCYFLLAIMAKVNHLVGKANACQTMKDGDKKRLKLWNAL